MAAAIARAGLAGTILQIYGGFAQTFTGRRRSSGAAGLRASGRRSSRWPSWRSRGGGGGLRRWTPFAFAAVAAAPLFAAGWAVGARYYYLPSVGLCWAVAEALTDVGTAPARVTLGAALLLVGAAQAAERRQEVVSYDRRVAAARRAVAAGLAAGHHVFHVDGGIKDLDLALKEDPTIEAGEVLVLSDVPASFAIVPPRFAVGGARS